MTEPAIPEAAQATLIPLLEASKVPMPVLARRYRPLLEMVRALIGVVPACDEYLEIWPPAFRTYNLLVPNFLNLPFSLFGASPVPVPVVGLGMYVASRVAECPYCSAHTTSFALRRGVSAEKVARALAGDGAGFSPGELATIAAARALARIPCEITAEERGALSAVHSPEAVEWIVSGIAMMGFLNKWMDAVGVPLEASTAAETLDVMDDSYRLGKSGWALDGAATRAEAPRADTIWTKLGVLPLLPAALWRDTKWQRGVPGRWPEVGAFLRERTGHDFPVLGRLLHARVIRAIAAALRENLDPATTAAGLLPKSLAGLVFTRVVADGALHDEVLALARTQGATARQIEDVVRFADGGGDVPGGDARERAIQKLARAIAPSPARVDREVVAACRDAGLDAATVVEIVTFVAVLQMLHRLTSYYSADASTRRS
jgi:alkylhydroperoxidase family enzyme